VALNTGARMIPSAKHDPIGEKEAKVKAKNEKSLVKK
jgi:hypothetical protein